MATRRWLAAFLRAVLCLVVGLALGVSGVFLTRPVTATAVHVYDGASNNASARSGIDVAATLTALRSEPRSARAERTVPWPAGSVVAAEGGGVASETFFRTMSKENFAELQATGRVPATAETFISPSAGFSSAYEGQMVQFSVRSGTTDALAQVGVRDTSALVRGAYPEMPSVFRGWAETSAFFKGEGGIINIGLGRGTALDVFNEAIQGFRPQ